MRNQTYFYILIVAINTWQKNKTLLIKEENGKRWEGLSSVLLDGLLIKVISVANICDFT